MYIIKKYHNRKLYLPATSIEEKKISGRYITSKQLLELDKEKGVKVIDNQSKGDITDETILSAIYELAKSDTNIRALLLESFHDGEKVLATPTFLFESVETEKTTTVTPALNTSERVIKEEVKIPANTTVAEPAPGGFSGFGE